MDSNVFKYVEVDLFHNLLSFEEIRKLGRWLRINAGYLLPIQIGFIEKKFQQKPGRIVGSVVHIAAL